MKEMILGIMYLILMVSYPYGLYISFFKGFGWLMLALVFPPYPVIVGLMHMFSWVCYNNLSKGVYLWYEK